MVSQMFIDKFPASAYGIKRLIKALSVTAALTVRAGHGRGRHHAHAHRCSKDGR
jgi:hypothetical protein